MARTGIKRRALGEIPVNTPPRRTQNAKKGLRVARGAAKKVSQPCALHNFVKLRDLLCSRALAATLVARGQISKEHAPRSTVEHDVP